MAVNIVQTERQREREKPNQKFSSMLIILMMEKKKKIGERRRKKMGRNEKRKTKRKQVFQLTFVTF